MSDIVERLRQQATVEAKKFGDARDIQIEWRAAEEIERLRARVAVLERVWEAAQAWREDMTMPTDQIRSGAIGCRLINALAETKP
jgi:hypothetical protein